MTSNMKINLWDLPKDRVWIKLERSFQYHLIKEAWKIAGSLRKLAKMTHISLQQIRDPEQRLKAKSLRFFTHILRILRKNNINYKLSNIQNKTVDVQAGCRGKPIKNPRLPFNFDSKYGGIVLAGIYFDGGVNSTGDNYGRPFYCNQKEIMRENYMNACREVFGDIKFTIDKSNTITFSKVIGLMLIHYFGFIPGRKTMNKPEISKLILENENKEFISSFLRQAFSDDGTIGTSAVILGNSIDVTDFLSFGETKVSSDQKFAPNLLKDLKYLVEKVSIHVNGPRYSGEYKYFDKKGKEHIVYSWKIEISGKENLRLFRDEIGFIQYYQQKKLERIISNIKMEQLPRSQSLDIVLNCIDELTKENKRICTKTLSEKLNRGEGMTSLWLKRLTELGYIKRISGKGCRFYPYFYQKII